jgi:hypothetical protein
MVRVSSRESATGRRRIYQGPAPGVAAARQQQELTEALQKQTRVGVRVGANKKANGRSHAA